MHAMKDKTVILMVDRKMSKRENAVQSCRMSSNGIALIMLEKVVHGRIEIPAQIRRLVVAFHKLRQLFKVEYVVVRRLTLYHPCS